MRLSDAGRQYGSWHNLKRLESRKRLNVWHLLLILTGRLMTRLSATVVQSDSEVSLAQAAAPVSSGGRRGLMASLLVGVGGLGLALAIERGGSFLSSVLAARWGGAEVFGAYSVALMAANNVAWYAGSG